MTASSTATMSGFRLHSTARRIRRGSSLFVFLLSMLLRGTFAGAQDELRPLHVRVLGREVPCDTSPLATSRETYATLEVLSALGASAEMNPSGDSVIGTTAAARRRGEIALARPHGKTMVPLSDVAKLLDAVP